jgi:hypothetical protein
MDAIELIKKILKVIQQDKVADKEQSPGFTDANRFRQIDDLDKKSATQYSNSPDEKYADVDSVTTKAGGGINYAKHPADIRADSVSMYPEFKGFRDYYNDLQQRQADPHADMIDVMNKESE